MPSVEDEPQPLFTNAFIEALERESRRATEERLAQLFPEEQPDDQEEPDIQERLKAAGKTSRDDAERELNELRSSTDYSERTVVDRIRLRVYIRIINKVFCEVIMQIRLCTDMPWLNAIAGNRPLLVSCHGQSDFELIVLSIERFITADAKILGYELSKLESKDTFRQTEYQAWIDLHTRNGVAVRARPDGMLNVYGL